MKNKNRRQRRGRSLKKIREQSKRRQHSNDPVNDLGPVSKMMQVEETVAKFLIELLYEVPVGKLESILGNVMRQQNYNNASSPVQFSDWAKEAAYKLCNLERIRLDVELNNCFYPEVKESMVAGNVIGDGVAEQTKLEEAPLSEPARMQHHKNNNIVVDLEKKLAERKIEEKQPSVDDIKNNAKSIMGELLKSGRLDKKLFDKVMQDISTIDIDEKKELTDD